MNMQAGFLPLLCINRIDETADVSTFEFKHLDDALFEFKAGQFISFEVDVAGELEYRAYSISSSPAQSSSVSVTIKRVPDGKVSNYLLDNLQPGIALPAMAPVGEFTLQDCASSDDLLLMSAGSGITPCLSMARWLLDTKQQVQIHFIYSAQTEADVIMAQMLEQLAEQHDHFRLTRIIESPTGENSLKADVAGRLNLDIFKQLEPSLVGKTIFSCGPTPYMDAVIALAKQREFDMDLFHKESFVPEEAEEVSESWVSYQIMAPQYGKAVAISAEDTLLNALEAAGVPVIGACRSGFCGSCKCKVTGEVESSSQATLTPEQIEQGYVLSCSSKAKSDLVVEL